LLSRLYSKTRSYAAERGPSHGTRRVCALCCISLITGLLAGCEVNVGGKQRPLLRHERIQGDVELTAERRSDSQSTSGNNRKSESNVFEERVGLTTQGDVYHPDFLFFNAAVGMGLAQQQLWIDGDYDKHGEWLNDYNVFAQLLRAKSYPASLYATRSEDLISREFLGALRTQRESRGVTMSLRSQDWPMSFQYTTSNTHQDDLTPPTTDFFARDDRRLRYSATHNFGDWSHISFNFNRTEVTQQSPGALVETDTDEYTVLHDLLFGSDRQHRLDSLLSYTNQSGTFDFRNVQVEERLRLQHTDNFLTNYTLRYAKFQREDIGNEEIRGQAGFEHRLYESLVTTANVFTSKTDLESQGILHQHGGMVGLSYRKNNPWGILLSSYTANLTQSNQSGGSSTGVVIGESHTATELIPVELDRVNIDVSSIRVRDGAGLLYQEGEDYTITQRNGHVWLNIITVGGATPPNFTEGEEFFVDYNFFIEPERRERTLLQNFTARQRFDNGFSVYYAHRRQDDTVTSTVTSVTPDQYTVDTIGTDYSNKGLFLGAEYSDENSSQIPSTSRKLEGRYSWPISPATNASIQVLNNWLDFGAPESRNVVLFKSGGEIFTRLTKNYGISARADFRNEDDSRFGLTRGFQFTSELQYNVRQLSVVAGVEFSTLSRRNDKIDDSYFYLRLKRFF
jgi:hypothetical protein